MPKENDGVDSVSQSRRRFGGKALVEDSIVSEREGKYVGRYGRQYS